MVALQRVALPLYHRLTFKSKLKKSYRKATGRNETGITEWYSTNKKGFYRLKQLFYFIRKFTDYDK